MRAAKGWGFLGRGRGFKALGWGLLGWAGIMGCAGVVSGGDETRVDGDQTTDAMATPADWSQDYCESVGLWNESWIEKEDEILTLINEARAQGARCGREGTFPPAPPLARSAALRCAARVHSKDMAVADYFAHESPAGEEPWERIEEAGYHYQMAGENIAGGYPSAAEAVAGWLKSDGHCANLMDARFVDTGVGYYAGAGTYYYYWTQTFGLPAALE